MMEKKKLVRRQPEKGRFKRNFYAVTGSHKSGIFTSWSEASKYVKGISGAACVGHKTLEKAKKDLLRCGYTNPVVYDSDNESDDDNHNEVDSSNTYDDMRACASDTNLSSIPIFQGLDNVDMIFSEPNENRIATIEHPLIDTHAVSHSFSDSNIFPQYDSTFPKEIVQTNVMNSSSSSDEVIINNPFQSTFVSEPAKLIELESNIDHTNSDQNEAPSIRILTDMMNEIISLKEDIRVQSEYQKTLIDKIHCLEETQTVFKQCMLKEVQTLNNEIKGMHNEISTSFPVCEDKGRDELSTQINVPVWIEKTDISMAELKHSIDTLSTNVSQLLSVSEKTSNITGNNKLHLTSKSVQTTPFDSTELNLDSKSELCLDKPISDDRSESSPDILQELDDEEDETSIIKHHALSQRIQPKFENTSKTPTLYLPGSCIDLVVGDSSLKDVNKRGVDASGGTEIRTFRGASIVKLNNIVKSCNESFPQVENVIVSAGSTECRGKVIECSDIIHNCSTLASSIHEKFPNATLSFMSIPPIRNNKANSNISQVNNKLKRFCQKNDIEFIESKDLWLYVSNDGTADRSLFSGNVQLSTFGLSLYLRPINKTKRAKAQHPKKNIGTGIHMVDMKETNVDEAHANKDIIDSSSNKETESLNLVGIEKRLAELFEVVSSPKPVHTMRAPMLPHGYLPYPPFPPHLQSPPPQLQMSSIPRGPSSHQVPFPFFPHSYMPTMLQQMNQFHSNKPLSSM